jgi:P pilus assembly chaperone PapD
VRKSPAFSLAVALWLTAHGSQLTTALAVEVDPMRIERSIPLKEPTEGELTLSNPGAQAAGIRISASHYRSFQPDLPISSAEKWIRLEPSSFTLAPGASTMVRYRIEPPAEILQDTAGEYLASILVDQLPADPVERPTANRVNIVPRLAIPVYLQVEERRQVAIQIKKVELSTLQSGAQESGEELPPELLRIDTTLRNAGTVHVRPVGQFSLFDAEKGTLVRGTPLGKTAPILASADLTVPTLFPLPTAGPYRLVLTLEPGAGEMLQKEVFFEVTEGNEIVVREKT